MVKPLRLRTANVRPQPSGRELCHGLFSWGLRWPLVFWGSGRTGSTMMSSFRATCTGMSSFSPRQSCCCPWWSCSLAECSPWLRCTGLCIFQQETTPLVDGSNVASIASEVLPRLTQVRKLFVLSISVLLLHLAVLLLLLIIFLLISCKGCCFPDVGLAPPAVATAIACTTLNFVSVRYYPHSFLQYNFERTIFYCMVSSNG